METYAKESTAKTQATKLSNKTGDCYYIEQIGDEFAVMTGAEFTLYKIEQEAKAIAATREAKEAMKASAKADSGETKKASTDKTVTCHFTVPKDAEIEPRYLRVKIDGKIFRLARSRIEYSFDDGDNAIVTMTRKYFASRPELAAQQ